MDILRLSHALQQDAVTIVFLNVLLKQLNLPIPAVPTLLLAGSLSAALVELTKILAAAVLASVMGDWSVVVAKFIPGFSAVAPPIAGALRMPQLGFLVATGLGAGVWAGLPLAVGWVLKGCPIRQPAAGAG